MRLGRRPVETAPAPGQDGPGRTEAAPTVSLSTQAEIARQSAAERRTEAAELEQRAVELEALAVVEARRQSQVAEAERLEAQVAELEAGPIPKSVEALAAATAEVERLEARRAELVEWLSERRAALERDDQNRLNLARDGTPGSLVKASQRRAENVAAIVELEAALKLADADLAESEARQERLIDQVRSLHVQVDQLADRTRFLRRCDGQPEEVQLAEDKRLAHEELVRRNPGLATLATALGHGVTLEGLLR